MTRRFRDLPVGRKLVAVALASSALALAVSSAIVLGLSFVSVRDSLRDELKTQAEIVAENASAAVAFQNQRDAEETLSSLRLMPSVDLACIFSTDVQFTASYIAPSATSRCPTHPPADGELVTDRGITIVQAVAYDGRRYGTLMIQGNLQRERDRLGALAIATMAAVVVGVIAAVVLSARLRRVVADPIQELSATADRISRAGDYKLRATKRGDDEIGHLVDTFNTMVAEVERRDEQLRAASRLKDEFLAALSHELRTPLNAVLGWTQVLRTGQASTDTVAKAYESIERNARAQATLIEDLLDISRIVSGKLNLRSDPVDLTAVIEAALEVVRPASEAKDIRIHRTLAPSPQFVMGDVDRLQQIAWNLLSNAVKFTAKGGRIDVTLGVSGDNYLFEVRDDGVGIAPDFLPHVFDRFRQADGSLTRRHGGLGLGLAIVRELAELHGGRVRAESPGPGAGATFVVTLPRPAGLSALPDRALAPGRARLDGISVLVVDDDEDARQVAAIAVARAGGTAQAVESVDEANQVLAAQRFDVILSDLAMPGTDGYDFVRRLRADPTSRTARTPVIAVTAHAGFGAEARARASGFQEVVTKPYDLDTLFDAIRRAMARDAAS